MFTVQVFRPRIALSHCALQISNLSGSVGHVNPVWPLSPKLLVEMKGLPFPSNVRAHNILGPGNYVP
jgi:hypothetical protein